MISSTAAAIAPLQLRIIASSDNDLGMWAIVHLERNGRQWRQLPGVGGYATMTATAYPSAYGVPGVSQPDCPDLPGCRHPVAFDGSRAFTVTPTASSRFYVISAHASVRVELQTPGWQVQSARGVSARRVLAQDATATGVGTLGRFAEHFRSASAPGGRYGSAVFAAVPCEGGGIGSARLTGTGAVDVTGDMEPRPLQCSPETRAGGFTFAYSAVQTAWRLEGDVYGVGHDLTRLFVFDFPKP